MMYDHPPAPIVVCHDCTQAEKDTLKFLQHRGIRNINALATVMGNIKQESKFDHLICEGGQRTCLLYTSPSPRDATLSRMPSSA